MKEFSARWLGIGGDTGLVARCVAVTGWMLVILLPVAAVGYLLYGWPGVVAAAVAAACCLAGALPPLLLAHWLRGPNFALHHVVIGMFSRMAIPLALGLVIQNQVIQNQQGPLSQAGFLIDLVVFFCVGLAYDTLSLLAGAAQTNSHTARHTSANPG